MLAVAGLAVWTSASSHDHYKPSGVGHRAGAVVEGAGVDVARMLLRLIRLL